MRAQAERAVQLLLTSSRITGQREREEREGEREREGAANGGVSSEVETGKGKRGAELGMHVQDRKGSVSHLTYI